ncbi:hypothetical protein LLH00_01225 [bacterium]|nr:hypothetical protein [bacterium]
MRRAWILAALLLSAIVALTACQKHKPIEGVWEFVSSTYTTPDTTINRDQDNWKAIKIITPTFFSTVGHDPNRPLFGPVVTDSDIVTAYNTFSGNGGRYKINGDIYTEYLAHFNNPNRVNTSADLKFSIVGDTLFLSNVTGDVTWKEIWRRLE